MMTRAARDVRDVVFRHLHDLERHANRRERVTQFVREAREKQRLGSIALVGRVFGNVLPNRRNFFHVAINVGAQRGPQRCGFARVFSTLSLSRGCVQAGAA